MLYVETEAKTSPIHGTGCFALHRIVQGELVYRFNSNFDRDFSPLIDLDKLPRSFVSFLQQYAWQSEGAGWMWLSIDNARFINHSSNPNIGTAYSGDIVALQDIEVGQEIVQNYNECDYRTPTTDAFFKRCAKLLDFPPEDESYLNASS